MELEWEPEKKGKKTQESEHERWARLDKEMKGRDKLTRLGIGTLFSSYYNRFWYLHLCLQGIAD